jgi:dihydropteroate synthase
MALIQEVPPYFSLNCRGRILALDRPRVMGILNLTPDSFSDGGQYNQMDKALRRVEEMLAEGADIIDIGGYSSRPNAPEVSEGEEKKRIEGITQAVLERFPQALVSIDTFRSGVAQHMLTMGVHMINDISAGEIDPAMWHTLLQFGDVPYILMHMQGRPQTMQENPTYDNLFAEIYSFMVDKVRAVRDLGLRDIVIDPGFGFGKRLVHNYELLGQVQHFQALRVPLLVGISRKSMLYRLFHTRPDDVLELASALHLQLLEKGAHILRVHDVRAARRIVDLYLYMKEHGAI